MLIPVLLVACGDSGTGKPGDLDPALVGPWRYASTNIYDVFAMRLRIFLSGLDLTPEEAEASVQETVAGVQESFRFYDPEEVLTFAADGTWTSSVDGGGRWHVDDGVLHLTGVGTNGLNAAYGYAVEGSQLTYTVDRSEAERILAQTEGMTDDLLGLFSVVFQETDLFVYALVRVE